MKIKKYAAISAIVLVVAVAIMIFVASFFQVPRLLDRLLYHYTEINRFVQRLFSLLLLLIVGNLGARKRLAWLLCIVILAVSLFMHFLLHYHVVHVIIIFCELYALAALLLSQDYFKRPSNKLSLKHALMLAAIGISAVFFNAVIGRANLSAHMGQALSFQQSIAVTLRIIWGGNSGFPAYEWFIFCFVWLCVVGFIILVLRSAIIEGVITKAEKERARELVKKYGQNPSSYLTLEDDKLLYFGQEVEGVIAYGVVGGVVVVNGDPITAPEDFIRLLAEFKAFCSEHSYQCIFLGTTDVFIEQYILLGYSHVKCGEEARFALADYQLAGRKMARLRAMINHANHAGLTTYEYKPLEKRDETIEKGMHEVSRQWLQGKKSGKLGFTVGDAGLEEPLDRRYFYAKDSVGRMVAFHVFIPFAGMNGYMADVTRRLPDAPGGATEKIMYDALMIFKEEGLHWGSMGLASLANVREDGMNDSVAAKLLEFIYEKGNVFYGFKDLHRAKEKYSPSAWVPGYFVYSAKTLTPQLAYAAIKIQDTGGVQDFLGSFLKRKLRGLKREADHEENQAD